MLLFHRLSTCGLFPGGGSRRLGRSAFSIRVVKRRIDRSSYDGDFAVAIVCWQLRFTEEAGAGNRGGFGGAERRDRGKGAKQRQSCLFPCGYMLNDGPADPREFLLHGHGLGETPPESRAV